MLVDLLMSAAERTPRRIAVADGARSLTYRRLLRLSQVLRGMIDRLDDSPRVGVMLPASTAFPAVLFGLLWARRTVVPLNFLLHGSELSQVVDDAGLNTILTGRHFADQVRSVSARPVFLEDLALPRRVLLATLSRLPEAPRVAPEDTAVMLYTSGTTAQPKGVELTYRNLHRNSLDAIEALGITGEQRFLNILPPFHVFGLTGCVLIPVVLSATVHAIPRFNPIGVVRAVREHRVSVMLAIPSMYRAMLSVKSARAEDFAGVRLAISGGEPLPDSVFQAFRERFNVTIRQGYGLTETSPVVSFGTFDADKPGTVGRPIPNVEVRIVGASGQPVPTGAEGEVLIRGPGVMKGYHNKPEQTRLVLSSDGWFSTGDLGRLDHDGFLTITGRAKDMLIIGGENVSAREIESVLEAHDGVMQAAVIGVPDDLRGELPVAFVVPRSGVSIDESTLRNHARSVLAGFKVPRRVIIRDDLPLGPTGKILKRKLRELL